MNTVAAHSRVDEVEAVALVYCQGAYLTTNGKTAHGLVRRSERYAITAVVDSDAAGRDAGEALDGRFVGIPIVASIDEGLALSSGLGRRVTHLVVGLAPDGGRLPAGARADVAHALSLGLHVVSGLHDFLSEDPTLLAIASRTKATLCDVRKPPPRDRLHFFCGKIERVDSWRVALLGTDSAVGKRTTAWMLVDDLRRAGRRAELIGTGQTAWLQGAEYSIVLDSLINDFVSGEIEHAIWRCFEEARPDVMVLEGQGSLLNPAYPGGFELLAAGRPHCVVLQHAPARKDYDGFPGFPIQPIETQIAAIELISCTPVVAVTVSSEGMSPKQAAAACAVIEGETGRLTVAPLVHGTAQVTGAIAQSFGLRQGVA